MLKSTTFLCALGKGTPRGREGEGEVGGLDGRWVAAGQHGPDGGGASALGKKNVLSGQ